MKFIIWYIKSLIKHKQRFHVSFHLKSGTVLKVWCNTMTHKATNACSLAEYSLTGLPRAGQAHFISLQDVSAITYKSY